MIKNVFALLALGASLSACALTEDVAKLDYTPTAAASQSGQGVNVTVSATDVREARRDRISTKINGYGMEMAPIRSEQQVDAIVKGALEAELKQRGYNVGSGGANVNAAVRTFYNDFGIGLFAGKATGDVVIDVTVNRSGTQIYKRTLTAQNVKSVQMAGGKNAAASLSAALNKAMDSLFADPEFVRAIANQQAAISVSVG